MKLILLLLLFVSTSSYSSEFKNFYIQGTNNLRYMDCEGRELEIKSYKSKFQNGRLEKEEFQLLFLEDDIFVLTIDLQGLKFNRTENIINEDMIEIFSGDRLLLTKRIDYATIKETKVDIEIEGYNRLIKDAFKNSIEIRIFNKAGFTNTEDLGNAISLSYSQDKIKELFDNYSKKQKECRKFKETMEPLPPQKKVGDWTILPSENKDGKVFCAALSTKQEEIKGFSIFPSDENSTVYNLAPHNLFLEFLISPNFSETNPNQGQFEAAFSLINNDGATIYSNEFKINHKSEMSVGSVLLKPFSKNRFLNALKETKKILFEDEKGNMTLVNAEGIFEATEAALNCKN